MLELIVVLSVAFVLLGFIILIEKNRTNHVYQSKEKMYFDSKSVKMKQEYMIDNKKESDLE
jgi:hypothetical protein